MAAHAWGDERVGYAVEKDIVDRQEAIIACREVLNLLRPHLDTATVDAYSDYRDELPPDAAEAERWLRERGRTLGRSDEGMGIDLDLADGKHWEVLNAYAPWSINVDLFGAGGRDLGGLYDCGLGIVAALTAAEAAILGDRLAPISPVLPLSEYHARQRAEDEARRAERRARRRQWLRSKLRRQ